MSTRRGREGHRPTGAERQPNGQRWAGGEFQSDRRHGSKLPGLEPGPSPLLYRISEAPCRPRGRRRRMVAAPQSSATRRGIFVPAPYMDWACCIRTSTGPKLHRWRENSLTVHRHSPSIRAGAREKVVYHARRISFQGVSGCDRCRSFFLLCSGLVAFAFTSSCFASSSFIVRF
jgi:hypothetical protein